MRHALFCFAAASSIASAAPVAGPFTLTSTSFADGAVMPLKYAGNLADNPNCAGSNVSPQLAWSNLPDGTRSIALLMVDPEARGGQGINHWVAYGIPPARKSLAEGAASAAPNGFVGGKSTLGLDHYVGPCTPPNMNFHHYTFVAIATDLAPDALPAGLTREELLAKLDGHAKGSAGLIGLFKHR